MLAPISIVIVVLKIEPLVGINAATFGGIVSVAVVLVTFV